MFGWLYNALIVRSKLFQRVAREKNLLQRENYELTDKITERKREIGELSIELEIQREERESVGIRLEKLRSTKNALERELSQHKQKAQDSIPLQAIKNMIESSNAASLYLTSDLIILYGNKTSKKYFSEEIIGKGMWELGLSDNEIGLLREKAEKSTKPFIYEFKKSRLDSWYIIPAKEENGKLVGYILTNKKDWMKKLHSMLRYAWRYEHKTENQPKIKIELAE